MARQFPQYQESLNIASLMRRSTHHPYGKLKLVPKLGGYCDYCLNLKALCAKETPLRTGVLSRLLSKPRIRTRHYCKCKYCIRANSRRACCVGKRRSCNDPCTSAAAKSLFCREGFSKDQESTIILHRNPHFSVCENKRSEITRQKNAPRKPSVMKTTTGHTDTQSLPQIRATAKKKSTKKRSSRHRKRSSSNTRTTRSSIISAGKKTPSENSKISKKSNQINSFDEKASRVMTRRQAAVAALEAASKQLRRSTTFLASKKFAKIDHKDEEFSPPPLPLNETQACVRPTSGLAFMVDSFFKAVTRKR